MSKIRAGDSSGVDAAPKRDFGERILAMAERLAAHSDSPSGLECTFLRPAHRATAADLLSWMGEVGLFAAIDGIGNVVGRLPAADPAANAATQDAGHRLALRHGAQCRKIRWPPRCPGGTGRG